MSALGQSGSEGASAESSGLHFGVRRDFAVALAMYCAALSVPDRLLMSALRTSYRRLGQAGSAPG